MTHYESDRYERESPHRHKKRPNNNRRSRQSLDYHMSSRPRRERPRERVYHKDAFRDEVRQSRPQRHSENRHNNIRPRPEQRRYYEDVDNYRRAEPIVYKDVQSLQKKKKEKSVLGKLVSFIFTLIFYITVVMILAGAAIFALSRDQDKTFFGYRIFTVLTNSMVSDGSEYTDGFSAGDVLIVQQVETENLKVGDVITYKLNLQDFEKDKSTYLTHRLIEIVEPETEDDKLRFITKGDANSSEDRPILPSQVIGKKAFVIPMLGGIMVAVQENLLVAIGFLVALFALIVSVKYYFSLSDNGSPIPVKRSY